MAEYIEREAAIAAVRHAWAKNLEPTQFIDEIPAADVAEVRHGHWIGCEDEYGSYLRCSVCADDFTAWEGDCAHTRFCPGCGARMDLGGTK